MFKIFQKTLIVFHILIIGFAFSTNIYASEILFLSRETDTKWSLTSYYLNAQTLGSSLGKK